jgi:hypothetical protein
LQGQFGDLRKNRLSELPQIGLYLQLRFSVQVRARENPQERLLFKAKAYFKKHLKKCKQN